MERQRIIVITPEERKYLQKIFGCSGVTVWEAVKYRKSNDIHKRIRKAAIERGNRQVVLVPEFEAIYINNRRDADEKMCRYMMQPFENGATLEGNFATGLMVLRDKHGTIKGQWQNPRVSEISAIQEVAMSL